MSIIQARAFLETSQPEKALEVLSIEINEERNQTDVNFLSIFGETLLEVNQLEQAYQVLYKACELDPTGEVGVEKFLYLGQIIGGKDGLEFINTGLNRLNEKLTNLDMSETEFKNELEYKKWIVEKLNQGIFAEIEIWMTDLCMEPEAEVKCNELIQISLSLNDENPETWSLLSSIKISQQLNQEAIEALHKSWELFQKKKTDLESTTSTNQENEDTFETSMAYIELIQPLLTLAKFSIELEQYDLAISITSSILDINDSILDCYYVEVLANLLKCKQIIAKESTEKVSDYREIPNEVIPSHTKNDQISTMIDDIKLALTHGYKIINSGLVEESDPEVIDCVNDLVKVFGGPIMSELLPKRHNDEEDEENWEDEINYEDN